ncbi:hypothetical protein [Nitrosomonas sp. Nm34]|uniref:hypothetical protein n=1 Tax=Nitrosomonas sp. Nm34 TaxID=1881055 RepID=UPI0008EB4B93|nr:hypothetical protein [Nitrosomonas sp. Nm34]SFJ04374.1 hypothetical protein SAMN05428978_10888 [Nitrosomonas sp. Nm34]
MASRVEQMMGYLYAKLAASGAMTTIASSSVFRDLDSALNGELPAVVIEEGDELTPELPALGIANRQLTIRLMILIKGSAPYSLADAPLIEAYNLIMSDRTVNNMAIDLTEGETRRTRGMLEKPVAIVSKEFVIQFRTDETSLL